MLRGCLKRNDHLFEDVSSETKNWFGKKGGGRGRRRKRRGREEEEEEEEEVDDACTLKWRT